jgi:hypothetical protein
MLLGQNLVREEIYAQGIHAEGLAGEAPARALSP